MFPNKVILQTGSGPTQPSLPSQPFQTLCISPRTPEQFPGPARDPQVRTSRMPVAQRWELAFNGAGAPGAACSWYSALHTPQQLGGKEHYSSGSHKGLTYGYVYLICKRLNICGLSAVCSPRALSGWLSYGVLVEIGPRGMGAGLLGQGE